MNENEILFALQGMRQVCMLQCVAVCCSVLQCIYTYIFIDSHSSRKKPLLVAGHASGVYVAVCCSVLQCAAVYIHVYT